MSSFEQFKSFVSAIYTAHCLWQRLIFHLQGKSVSIGLPHADDIDTFWYDFEYFYVSFYSFLFTLLSLFSFDFRLILFLYLVEKIAENQKKIDQN